MNWAEAYARGRRYWQIPDEILDIIIKEIPAAAVIHDLGCGTGELCGRLFDRGYKFTVGIDDCVEAVRLAREKFPYIEFRQQRIEDSFQPEACLKVMSLSLAFVTDRAAILRDLKHSTQKLFIATALRDKRFSTKRWYDISVETDELLGWLSEAGWKQIFAQRCSVKGEPDVLCVLCG